MFRYQKFVYRFAFLIAFFAFIGVIYYAYMTELLNPPMRSDVAPFEQNVRPVQSNAILNLQSDAPLSKPHVNNKEIQNWLSVTVSEALTFSGQDYDRVIKSVRSYFTTNGYEQYKNYLETAGIVKAIQSGTYKAGLFFEQSPYVPKGVEYQGIYRWQASMPVSISFKSRIDGQITNRKVKLSLQVRRVDKSISESGVQIDVWQAQAMR